jgi:phytanoyl-CoA hydroxylase
MTTLEAVPATTFQTWPAETMPAGYFTSAADPGIASFYREQGYLVLADALSPAELEELRVETARLCRNDGGKIGGVAPAEAGLSDVDAMRRILCIHFPHKLSTIFHHALSHPGTVEVLQQTVGPNVKCMQSMLFLKASGKPGQAWHQDEDYIPTRDRSLIGAWIALDDATLENGCLWVLPGSHQRGILWPQKFHFDERFDCARESYSFPWLDEQAAPVEVKAGSIVFFHGYLLHRSLPNRATGGFRRALVNHYMSAESLLPWRKEEKVSMALSDYRDVVLVAGKDPYAYKGTEDLAQAMVRADGQANGCADWNDDQQKALAAANPRSGAEATADGKM